MSKKFIFSAVALMAFSFAGMANSGVKKKKETQKVKKVESVEKAADCNLARFQAYVSATSAGFNHEDATGMSYSVYFLCLRLNSEIGEF